MANKQNTENHTPPRSIRVSDEEWSAWQRRALDKGQSVTRWMLRIIREAYQQGK